MFAPIRGAEPGHTRSLWCQTQFLTTGILEMHIDLRGLKRGLQCHLQLRHFVVRASVRRHAVSPLPRLWPSKRRAAVEFSSSLPNSVLEANLAIVRHGLVLSTFGNVSGIDRQTGRIYIKPSGVPYEALCSEDMVACDLDGRSTGNRLRPSSDIETHAVLYAAFPGIGAVVHTHSTFATVMAQAKYPIPVLGTTHADYFHGPIPVTRQLSASEVGPDYVANTGRVIVEAFRDIDPLAVPAVLVAGHGPFVWGRDPADAVHNALILEEVARMAWHALALAPGVQPIPQPLLDRHYLRKHGAAATYGQ